MFGIHLLDIYDCVVFVGWVVEGGLQFGTPPEILWFNLAMINISMDSWAQALSMGSNWLQLEHRGPVWNRH